MNHKSIKLLGAATLVSLFSAGSAIAQSSDSPTTFEYHASTSGNPIVAFIFLGIYFVVMIALIASVWKVFVKAGQPGWASLIPIYNTYILVKIVGKPILWFILCFIPVVNIVVGIILLIDLAKCFGKGTGFGLGLLFLFFIFWPILGFGDATYKGPAAA